MGVIIHFRVVGKKVPFFSVDPDGFVTSDLHSPLIEDCQSDGNWQQLFNLRLFKVMATGKNFWIEDC